MAAGNTPPSCTACSGPFSTSRWVAESPCPSQPLGQPPTPSSSPGWVRAQGISKSQARAGTSHPEAKRAISCPEGLSARGTKGWLGHHTTLRPQNYPSHFLASPLPGLQLLQSQRTKSEHSDTSVMGTLRYQSEWCGCPQEEVTIRFLVMSPLAEQAQTITCECSTLCTKMLHPCSVPSPVPCSCLSALPGVTLGTTEEEVRCVGSRGQGLERLCRRKRIGRGGGVKEDCPS